MIRCDALIPVLLFEQVRALAESPPRSMDQVLGPAHDATPFQVDTAHLVPHLAIATALNPPMRRLGARIRLRSCCCLGQANVEQSAGARSNTSMSCSPDLQITPDRETQTTANPKSTSQRMAYRSCFRRGICKVVMQMQSRDVHSTYTGVPSCGTSR